MIAEPYAQAADVARKVYGDQFVVINRYVDILRSTGVEWGLLGPREADRIWGRHILNSAALTGLIAADSTVADVGSGAGLPGVPPDLLRPDLRVTLIEPLLRRSTFLTQTLDELGIADHVEAVRSRAEDHHRTYQVVIARALAPLDRLIGWCNPLRASGGAILAIKGASAADEVASSRQRLKALQLNAEVLSVRGTSGRDWLADRLREAGAALDFVAAYRRVVPDCSVCDGKLIDKALAEPGRHLWFFSSSEAIDNLAQLRPGTDWSSSAALATHPRIAQTARQLGFGRVDEARPAFDAVVACIQSRAS